MEEEDENILIRELIIELKDKFPDVFKSDIDWCNNKSVEYFSTPKRLWIHSDSFHDKYQKRFLKKNYDDKMSTWLTQYLDSLNYFNNVIYEVRVLVV